MAFWFLNSFADLALILVQAAYCLFSVAGTLSEKRWYGIIAMATIKWLQWLQDVKNTFGWEKGFWPSLSFHASFKTMEQLDNL